MARSGICHGAQEVLMRDRAGYGAFSPVVLTANQADAMKTKKAWNSNYKLWKLKTAQPHLFMCDEKLRPVPVAEDTSPVADESQPHGMERLSPGWLLDRDKGLYVEEGTERAFFRDETGVIQGFSLGDDLSAELSFAGVAASSANTPSASSSGPRSNPSASSPAVTQARHIVIMDLHKAAEMFKLDWAHMDRPAAMLAVYRHATGAVAPEFAAKGLHDRILRRFASYRGVWSPSALQAGLITCMEEIAAEHRARCVATSAGAHASGRPDLQGIPGAVALVLGSQLVTAVSHGAACVVADSLPDDMKDIRVVAASPPWSSSSSSTCGDSAEAARSQGGLRAAWLRLDERSAECILLHTDPINEHSARLAASHAERGRLRAAAIRLLQGGTPFSRAAACARLTWGGAEAPAAKRLRTDAGSSATSPVGAGPQVRCRQILLKYVGCEKAIDPVRRKPVSRSLGEAEALLADVLEALEAARRAYAAAGGGAPGSNAAKTIAEIAAEAAAFEAGLFTKHVRAISDDTASLKGGDLAGDAGWLRMPVVKPGEKLPKEVTQRFPMLRAALALAVGEVSDIIVSDDGVRLLKRSA